MDESGSKSAPAVPGWLGAAVDYGPLVAFFASYEVWGLTVATAVVMGATVLALAASWLMLKRVAFIPAMTAVIVGVLGGLTLYLNDPQFIKLKPTIVYLLFAAIVGIELATGKPLIMKAMTAAMPPITPAGKRVLMLRFLLFFIAMAAINEVARRVLSTDHWVLWKVFGSIGGTFLFGLAQIRLFQRHQLPEEAPAE